MMSSHEVELKERLAKLADLTINKEDVTPELIETLFGIASITFINIDRIADALETLVEMESHRA
jgi:hypothetical protein